jgi:hypothetical protein
LLDHSSEKDCGHLRNPLQVHAFTLSFFNHEMSSPSGVISAEADIRMRKFLITATVANVALATLIPGMSLMKTLSSADLIALPSAVTVAGGGTSVRGEPPPSVPACWDDKSGQPHCHV